MDTANLEALRSLLNNYQIVTFDILAGEAGFEPTSTVLETAELPLFYSPKSGRNRTSVLYGEELLFDLDNLAGTYGTSTFTDSETETFVEGYRSDELNVDLNVIAWHNHLSSLWKGDLTGNIKCTDEELRTIVVVEWSVTSTFLFLEDVDLSLEVV